MNQKISIGIRVGDRCTEVGKVGEHIWIEVDPLGLSILGKKGLVEIDPVYSGSRKIGNYFRTSQDWGITRDLTNLVTSPALFEGIMATTAQNSRQR